MCRLHGSLTFFNWSAAEVLDRFDVAFERVWSIDVTLAVRITRTLLQTLQFTVSTYSTHNQSSGLENIVFFFENIENIRYFRYIYQAFAHTLLKLYEIYYQIIVCMCVCALHIRWSTLVIHTALLWRGAIWQKLSNTEKMLRAQVISQQNTQTEKQNVVTMCHIKKIFLKTC